jgi:choice-of-anchor B domain-containing protein
MSKLLRLSAYLAAGLCLVSSLRAHDGDPKLLHKKPMYPGHGWRNAERDSGDPQSMVVPPLAFPSSGVTLLSWISLPDFGVPAGGNGNSCYGYTAPSGREYALIGLSNGTAFVEITQPGNPVIVAQKTGPTSLWRDVRTFQHWAYCVSEGGGGIQVFDMANIDSGVVSLVNTIDDDATHATHTIAINQTSGYLYRSGGSSSGLRIYNLNPNPASPARVGTWSDRYSHEVSVFSYTSGPAAGKEIAYVCGGLNGGFNSTGLYVVDVTNHANPSLIKFITYPNAQYCHQIWPSPDMQWLYCDDELDDENLGITSVMRVFDNSNPLNVTFSGTYTNGNTSVDHNLYTKNDRIYQSAYRSGLRIYSTNNPGTASSPVEVGYFDTWPEDDATFFNGLWNNYPYFPSGVVIGSDIEKGLFVWWVGTPAITFTFPSGAPTVVDPAGQTFQVDLNESSPGTLVAGTAKLHYDTGSGWTTIDLVSLGGNSYNAVLPQVPCGTTVDYYVTGQSTNGVMWSDPAGAPTALHQAVAAATQVTMFSDDFQANQGWTVGFTGDTATTGVWTRVDPVGSEIAPENDHTPGAGTLCYVTGQGAPGGGAGDNDVDGGKTTLVSPVFDLSSANAPVIGYWRWYANHQLQGTTPDDQFKVDVSNNNGSTWTNVETIGPGGAETFGGWLYHEFRVADFVTPTAQVKVRFVANDSGTGSVVEAGIDDVGVTRTTCPTSSVTSYCFGDGSLVTACPCGNTGQPGRGCENSIASGGALLTSTGTTSPDTLVLTSSAELSSSLSIFLQGNANLASGTPFGDGVRCVGGTLKRLYVKNAVGGTVTAPAGGDPSITARSAAQGDTIAPGTTRYYQVYYRDANLGFCPAPQGDSWNVGNGLIVQW